MKAINSKRRHFGITMIECCVATTIAAATVGAAVPSFKQTVAKRHLQGIAMQVAADVLYARSEAVMRGESIRIDFGRSAEGSCYVLHTGGRGDCTCSAGESAVCAAGAHALKSVFVPAAKEVRIEANVTSMVFDGTHGTTSPAGTIQVLGTDGHAIRQIVNLMGRPRGCATGFKQAGMPTC
jgi:Tfp pilus assembly protein FimT